MRRESDVLKAIESIYRRRGADFFRFALARTSSTWEADWSDVLVRARLQRSAPRVTWRRVTLALVAVVAVIVPLAAVGAANDWWFVGIEGTATRASVPAVIKEGQWDGHPWQFVAYQEINGALCFSITPTGSENHGDGAALACVAVVDVPRTAETFRSQDLPITFLSGSASQQLPTYIAGPVIEQARMVEIRFESGHVLRVPTFAAPRTPRSRPVLCDADP